MNDEQEEEQIALRCIYEGDVIGLPIKNEKDTTIPINLPNTIVYLHVPHNYTKACKTIDCECKDNRIEIQVKNKQTNQCAQPNIDTLFELIGYQQDTVTYDSNAISDTNQDKDILKSSNSNIFTNKDNTQQKCSIPSKENTIHVKGTDKKEKISSPIKHKQSYFQIKDKQTPTLVQPHTNTYITPTINDRNSSFRGYAFHVNSLYEVKIALSSLQDDNFTKNATHNMYAYRFLDSKGTLHSDYDDDGEVGAGSKMLRILDLSKVENALIIVSRHYGGTQLGPSRFHHIMNVVTNAQHNSGFSFNGSATTKHIEKHRTKYLKHSKSQNKKCQRMIYQ